MSVFCADEFGAINEANLTSFYYIRLNAPGLSQVWSVLASEAIGEMGIARNAVRLTVNAEIQLRSPRVSNYPTGVRDLSATGCCIELVHRVRLDEHLWIKFSGLEALECIVCWEKEFTAGVEFVRPLHPAVMDMLGKRLKS